MQSLEYQLNQTQKLADMYREQVIQLEDAHARVREEGDIGKELFKVWPQLLCLWVIYYMYYPTKYEVATML